MIKIKYIFIILLYLSGPFSLAQNLYLGAGISSSGMKVVYNDFGEVGNFKVAFPSITINLLYEIKLGNHVALKTGPCLLNKSGGYKFTYIDIDGPLIDGVHHRLFRNRLYEFSYLSIDFPVLFTYSFIDPEKKFRFHLNIGPYLGRFIQPTFSAEAEAPGELTDSNFFYKFDFGYYASAGFGYRKWQLGCFMSKGLRNISNQALNANDIIKAKNNLTGINLIRVFHFSKKESKPL
jgi:hypothetical protein